jgi:hypothetical protein
MNAMTCIQIRVMYTEKCGDEEVPRYGNRQIPRSISYANIDVSHSICYECETNGKASRAKAVRPRMRSELLFSILDYISTLNLSFTQKQGFCRTL